ncbi:MAG: ATP-binding protein [Clostridia bacterium]|nr:ATP-binding protein [Clostridia bacterium]
MERSEIYAQIKREMEKYRDYAINKANEEIKLIYVKYPRLKEIDKELKNAGSHMLKETLKRRGEDRDKLVKEFKEYYANLENEKQDILNSEGISPDMLKPKFRCKLCEDTGIYKDKECKCMKKRRIEKMYTLSNIHENMEEQNFESFDSSIFSREPNEEGVSQYDRMLEISDTCREGIVAMEKFPFYALFMGGAGLGKTFLCSCVAKLAIELGYSVVYVTAYDIADVLIKIRFSRATGENYETLDLIKNCDLLIMDDLGTEGINGATNTEIFTVINNRILSKKSLIISTNLTLEDINRVYGERLVSRFIGEFATCQFIGKDLRLY